MVSCRLSASCTQVNSRQANFQAEAWVSRVSRLSRFVGTTIASLSQIRCSKDGGELIAEHRCRYLLCVADLEVDVPVAGPTANGGLICGSHTRKGKVT